MKPPATGALIAVAVLSSSITAAQLPPNQRTPRFRSNVELLPIDVSVVDDRGRPVLDLTPTDFRVLIDGTSRRVVSAEWISLVPASTQPATTLALPEGYSSNEDTIGGRLIVLAVDQPNIRFGGGRAVVAAMDRFIGHLSTSDRIAAVGFGYGAPSTPFTADRDRIKQAIGRMNGQKSSAHMSSHEMGISTAMAIARGDTAALDVVFRRDCLSLSVQMQESCRFEIVNEAMSITQNAAQEGDLAIRSLRALLTGLEPIDAPKTLVLVSEGFAMADNDAETASRLAELGSLAAAARTSLYILQLDEPLFDVQSAQAPISPFEDRRARANGLETLTGATRGARFAVTGTGDAIFERIESELSGYYLIGVETSPRDDDRRPHPLRVEVSKKGVTVHSRRLMLRPATETDGRARSLREVAAAALTTPLVLSALPLRAISFSLQGPDRSKVQLLIRADIGGGYRAPQSVAVAYMITDATGRVVRSESFAGRLTPPVNGVESSLPFIAGAELPPGEYTLKLAAAESDRVGSIEHPIHAALVNGGAVMLSDLMVGGPVPSGEPMRPTVDYTVRFGVVHGYLEAYGPTASDVNVKYEIAPARDEQAAALLSHDVAGMSAGDSRVLFSKQVPTGALPPGKYFLRAVVSAGGAPVTTLARAFEIAESAVSIAAKSGAAADAAPANLELFLTTAVDDLAMPFRLDEALRPETLQPFERRVPVAVRKTFEDGLEYLRKREYASAESTFKQAIQTDMDPASALAYLAVCFAASGHDVEASSVWQTALADGSDLPQIYLWLGDALLRAHDLSRGQSILEEAASRWPTDTRFLRPLAMLHATSGRGYEAVRMLTRYIAGGHADADTLFLGVEWLYQTHAQGGVVRSRADDLKLARAYADQYAKTKGPKQPLIKQWIDYLEKTKQ
jgi:VWFA-related protein